MIRRVFWVSVGAAAGITTYRRATAMGHAVLVRVTGDRSAAAPGPFWPPPGQQPPGQQPPPGQAVPRAARRAQPRPQGQWSTARAAWRTSRAAWRTQKAAVAQVRAARRFARDVREGMDLYSNRHQQPSGPTLTGTAGTAGTARTAPAPEAPRAPSVTATTASRATAPNGRLRGRTDHVKDGR